MGAIVRRGSRVGRRSALHLPRRPSPASNRHRRQERRPARATAARRYTAPSIPRFQAGREAASPPFRGCAPPRKYGSATIAAATADSVLAQLCGRPRIAKSTSAIAPGSGKTWVRTGSSSRSFSPKQATNRPARPTAAGRVICWPRTARTANSIPSHAQGTRKPRRASTSGASAESL
jgi:hypothetical protein